MKTTFALLLSLTLFACAGCHGSSAHAAANPQTSPYGHLQGRAYIGSQPGLFDYYVFNLSWTPDFCQNRPGNPNCAARPGFLVHGLWPQNNNGTYPEDCANPARPTITFAYLDLIPTVELIQHEWTAHGTCTGLNPDAYFNRVRTAFRSIEIPATFAATQTPPAVVDPQVILNQFHQDNPAFPRNGFVLTCQNNQLTSVDACFDKDLNPTACKGIPTCRARTIKIISP